MVAREGASDHEDAEPRSCYILRMSRRPPPSRVRFFWDFHGPEAEATARHFATHLGEFFERNDLSLEAGVEARQGGTVSVYSDMPDVPAVILQQLGHEAADDTAPTVAARVGEALRPQRIEPLSPVD